MPYCKNFSLDYRTITVCNATHFISILGKSSCKRVAVHVITEHNESAVTDKTDHNEKRWNVEEESPEKDLIER